jgi:hypothetical protein
MLLNRLQQIIQQNRTDFVSSTKSLPIFKQARLTHKITPHYLVSDSIRLHTLGDGGGGHLVKGGKKLHRRLLGTLEEKLKKLRIRNSFYYCYFLLKSSKNLPFGLWAFLLM